MCVCFLAARRKLVEKARQAGLGRFKKTSGTKTAVREMWEGGEGIHSFIRQANVW